MIITGMYSDGSQVPSTRYGDSINQRSSPSRWASCEAALQKTVRSTGVHVVSTKMPPRGTRSSGGEKKEKSEKT